MPSLFTYTNPQGINVAANYGRVVPQHTYGAQGTNYTNFGTRNLRFIKVNVTGGNNDLTKKDGLTAIDTTDAATTAATNYMGSLSLYSNAIRALQTTVEVWGVFTPSATDFIAVVSDDTANDSDTNSNVAGGWGDTEAAIAANLNASATVVVTSAAFTGAALAWA
jgi:hypothetical protein